MVGDDYSADVLGAKTAGWKAIWFNPGWIAAPGLLPLHDAEIHDMERCSCPRPPLPAGLRSLPGLAARTRHALQHPGPYPAGRCDGLPVGRLAGRKRRNSGPLAHPPGRHAARPGKNRLDPPGLERGPHGDHAAMARELLLERGQPELAEIADRHMLYRTRKIRAARAPGNKNWSTTPINWRKVAPGLD